MRKEDELAFVLIPPYSLLKSRTGGIIGRLLSLARSELIGVRMYAPSDEFVDAYIRVLEESSQDNRIRKAFVDYVDQNLRPENILGVLNRTMLLLFRGENAIRDVSDVVGNITSEPQGNTIRGTYGDFLFHPDGTVRFFEPAVLIGDRKRENINKQLRILADFAEKDGGVLEEGMKLEGDTSAETTLVMLKPDNFMKQSSRPGNIIDMFSRTGLYIVGAKLLSMSISQCREFYGFLEDVFVDKLKPVVAARLKECIKDAFDFSIPDKDYEAMADILRKKNARTEVNRIITYMSGRDPGEIASEKDVDVPGSSKCLAMLYMGENAVEKIRAKLGPTDPSKAEGGTVRSDYGNDLMKNGAHASDSVKSSIRERKIVGLSGKEPSTIKQYIDEYLSVVQ